MATGIRLLTLGVIYVMVINAFFYYLAASIYTPSGGTLTDSPPEFVEEDGDPDYLSFWTFFVGMLTFNVAGLPAVISLFAVYLPVLVIGIGIYGAVRGI